MIGLTKIKLPALACMAALVISGCSNTGEGFDLRQSLKTLFNRGAAEQPSPAKVDINTILKRTAPQSLIQVASKTRGSSALMLEIESDGGYRTYSTASKQTFTLRNGLVTATRGMGDDLMASVNEDSLALIRARRAGSGQRVMEYLNGAGDTIRLQFTCETYVTGSGRVNRGAVNASTTELTENCVAGPNKFTNVYQVDGTGMILESQQWIGQSAGYVLIRVLRR